MSSKRTAGERLALFELEMADHYIDDIWLAMFGPDEPKPARRTQVLSRIRGMAGQAGPDPRQLPIGVEMDE